MITHRLSRTIYYGRWSDGRRLLRIGFLCIDSRGIRRVRTQTR